MQVNVSGLSRQDFKVLERQLLAEMKNRGPSGEKKLPTNTPGLQAIIVSIDALAHEKQSNVVEVLDAVLRTKDAKFYIASSDRTKSGGNTAQEVSA